MINLFRIGIAFLTLATSASIARSATLDPIAADSLILVVNRQQPVGRKLAERYAALRGVPDGRIIEVDVPDLDDIAPEFYEPSIAKVVREQIAARGLRDKARCLVTFYGVPLRVRARERSPNERAEATTILEPILRPLAAQMVKAVGGVEALAGELDPTFKPPAGPMEFAEQMRARGLLAERAATRAIASMPDEAARTAANDRLDAARRALTQMPALPQIGATQPATRATQPQLTEWMGKPDDADARRSLREAAFASGNVFALLTVVEQQKAALLGGEDEASVDSELSCLWLPANYPRARWIPNPFHHAANPSELRNRMIRTARIDGPTPDVAARIIDESVAVEGQGLRGDAVLDARGLANGGGAQGSYDAYDRSISNVAKYLVGDKDLPTIFDFNEPLLPDGSSKRAAIYCGWYRLRKYASTVHCVPGSVAFHVASFEMISLHSPGERGWCRGLLLDGADVTIGPVGEPYLSAFPPADEFFSLLLTGKPTLVEAYWATIPLTSWKMVLVGDPLYRPFAKNPAIQASALPATLRAVAE